MVRCLPEGEPMLSGGVAVLAQFVLGGTDALLQSLFLGFAFCNTYLEAGVAGCKDDREQDRCLDSFAH